MKSRAVFKIIIDIAMTVALMLLMTYELIGQSTHEWIGMGMFALFLIHHVLNRKWSGGLAKGKWTPLRVWQTVLVLWVLVTMLGSMVSGIVLSRSVFAFLPIRSGQSWARTLHLLGLCWHEPALGLSLEHDDGNGTETFQQTFTVSHMATPTISGGDCRLWCLCFCKARHGQLHIAEKRVRLFQL